MTAMASREDIAAAARAWKGVRWKHQGRTRQGIDCAGLVVLVGRDLGILDYDHRGYPRDPDGTFAAHFDRALERIALADKQAGDVVVFTQSRLPCHCGILTERYGELSVVHAHLTRRRVIEEPLKAAEAICGPATRCYRFPGVTD